MRHCDICDKLKGDLNYIPENGGWWICAACDVAVHVMDIAVVFFLCCGAAAFIYWLKTLEVFK